jgi:hypothetical protein
LLFKLCVSQPHLLLCTPFLSFPFLSPGRLRKQQISPISEQPRGYRIANPTFSAPQSHKTDHLAVWWSVNVATTQNLHYSSDDFTPHCRMYRINCRQTRIMLHFMHALHLGKLHIEAFVVQARLVSRSGLLFGAPLI